MIIQKKVKVESLKPLKPLDLRKCSTLSDIVRNMEQCSFGARMLGEVTYTLETAIQRRQKQIIILGDELGSSLGKLLGLWVARGWFSKILTPDEYTKSPASTDLILIIGYVASEIINIAVKHSDRLIFINSFSIAAPGKVRDGYFPDVIFSDPRLVVPVIDLVLRERLNGEKKRVRDTMEVVARFDGLGHQVARGAAILRAMVRDKDCNVFLTISGAMTVAKMGLVICDMIDLNMVQYVASTGALMAHGLVESVGLHHYKYNPDVTDEELAKLKLNRVTDTLEPESNLDFIEKIIDKLLTDYRETVISPSVLHQMLGAFLLEKCPEERGILKSAYEKKVPVFVPAFTDSEIGNDFYLHNLRRKMMGRPKIVMDIELDTERLIGAAVNSKKMGIFTVGGGVPRNNTQNVAPLIEILNDRLHLNLPNRKFINGVRICPDEPYYGHLSGSTHEEAISWRKMDARGEFVGIKAEATHVWPFLVKYVMETV